MGSVPNRVFTPGIALHAIPLPRAPLLPEFPEASAFATGTTANWVYLAEALVMLDADGDVCIGKWLSERHHRHVRCQIVVLKDTNTLTLRTSSTAIGPQQLPLSAPDGEFVSLETAFLAQ